MQFAKRIYEVRMNSKKVIIAYRIIFVFLCGLGLILSLTNKATDEFMGNGTALNFYTLQSNLWVLILEMILLVETVIEDVKKISIIRSKMVVLKFVMTVAISLTFIVYWCMLAPYVGQKNILALSNILLHAVSPILMFIDFIMFDREYSFEKKNIWLAIIPPIYYLIFIIVRAEVSDTVFTQGTRYPYWFVDLDTFGWLGNINGPGVIYWVILMIIGVEGLGAILYKLYMLKNMKGENW